MSSLPLTKNIVSAEKEATIRKSVMKNHFDVVILGAGAAGLMCAITAAKRNKSVLVIENLIKWGKRY